MPRASSRGRLGYDTVTAGQLCPVAPDVVAVHNRTHIKFVFLKTGTEFATTFALNTIWIGIDDNKVTGYRSVSFACSPN